MVVAAMVGVAWARGEVARAEGVVDVMVEVMGAAAEKVAAVAVGVAAGR